MLFFLSSYFQYQNNPLDVDLHTDNVTFKEILCHKYVKEKTPNMKNIKKYLPLLILFFTQIVMAQQPCSAGFNANGDNDYITIPNTNAINIQNTKNRTIEMWFKTSDINNRQVLYEEGAQVNTILFFIEGGRVYVGGFRSNANSDANRRFFRSAAEVVKENEWIHIAFTVEDTGSPDVTFRWFLNGVQQDTQAGLQISSHSGNISIGRNGGNMRFPSSLTNNWTTSSVSGSNSETYKSTFTGQDSNDYNFKGNISLFRIWNTARDQNEIDTNKSEYITTNTADKLVAYQNGDQMVYDSNNDTSINATATANGSGTTYTWTSGSANYTTAANWSGNAPDVTKTQTVEIAAGTPTITTEVKIGRLTVASGSEIIVEEGATLHVYYELTNEGTITVEDGGALIFHACQSTIQGSGSFDIQRQSSADHKAYFYSYWSSPVVEADATPSTIFADAPVIYSFDSSSENSDWAYNGTSNFKPGIGYAVRSESAGSTLRTFSGKINEGNVVVNVYNTSNEAGTGGDNKEWSIEGDNLVGNPYASAIDWDLLIADTDNSGLSGAVYFWKQTVSNVGENNVGDYLVYNLTGTSEATSITNSYIGTGQGFFVKALSEDTTLTFKTTHQVAAKNTTNTTTNTTFYKGTNPNANNSKKEGRSWFTFNHNDKTNTLLVGFLDGATNRFDRLYDAPFDVNQTSMGFYTLVKGVDKASIQGLPVLKRDKKIVKLGFIVDEIGEYSIDIQNEYIDEDYYIYLRDTENKITVDLRQRKYSFTIDTIGENNTRFKLIYTKKKRKATQKTSGKQSLLVEEIDSKDFTIYVDGAKELIAEYDFDVDNIKEVVLYNIQGRKVASFSGAQTKDISNLKTGVYIVNATLQDNRRLTKKIVIAN